MSHVSHFAPVAHIESPFKEKFGVPRQAGLVDCEARIVFEPEYRVAEAVRGLEEFDYIWLLWQFHLNRRETSDVRRETLDVRRETSDVRHEMSDVRRETSESLTSHVSPLTSHWSPTVRPPRLGGNKRVGVFATRSPFRPNPIGLSSVRLLRIEPGPVLVVSAPDLVDGTPIYDIKPYIAYADAHPEARSGFAQETPMPLSQVVDDHGLLLQLPPDSRRTLTQTLLQDPRPHYQHDADRRYTVSFDRWEVSFRVQDYCVVIDNLSVKKS